jgi:hypothetical protein
MCQPAVSTARLPIPSRPLLVCAGEGCDFITQNSDAWDTHALCTGHPLQNDEPSTPDEPSATPRVAQCIWCNTERPSSPDLPFFADRSAGSKHAETTCRHCGYLAVAHGITNYKTNACEAFEALSEGAPFDEFYCGCGGWD